jgi:hypothetical protein
MGTEKKRTVFQNINQTRACDTEGKHIETEGPYSSNAVINK